MTTYELKQFGHSIEKLLESKETVVNEDHRLKVRINSELTDANISIKKVESLMRRFTNKYIDDFVDFIVDDYKSAAQSMIKAKNAEAKEIEEMIERFEK